MITVQGCTVQVSKWHLELTDGYAHYAYYLNQNQKQLWGLSLSWKPPIKSKIKPGV